MHTPACTAGILSSELVALPAGARRGEAPEETRNRVLPNSDPVFLYLPTFSSHIDNSFSFFCFFFGSPAWQGVSSFTLFNIITITSQAQQHRQSPRIGPCNSFPATWLVYHVSLFPVVQPKNGSVFPPGHGLPATVQVAPQRRFFPARGGVGVHGRSRFFHDG